MGKVWVLDTETKGTGANMVPLERVTRRSAGVEQPLFKPPGRRVVQPEPPKPRIPRRFRVVDLMTRQTLADDAGVRDAIEALHDVRSVVDVDVYIWHEQRDRWRKLTFVEKQEMLEMAKALA